MSQYRYYDGAAMSASMKRDVQRVRDAKPGAAYQQHWVTEKRMQAGVTSDVRVLRKPPVKPMTPRQRHLFSRGDRRISNREAGDE